MRWLFMTVKHNTSSFWFISMHRVNIHHDNICCNAVNLYWLMRGMHMAFPCDIALPLSVSMSRFNRRHGSALFLLCSLMRQSTNTDKMDSDQPNSHYGVVNLHYLKHFRFCIIFLHPINLMHAKSMLSLDSIVSEGDSFIVGCRTKVLHGTEVGKQ